ARRLERFTLGMDLKVLYGDVNGNTAMGTAGDIGFLYLSGKKRFVCGLALKNFGPKFRFNNQPDPMPVSADTGFSMRMFEDRINLAGGVEIPSDDIEKYKFGLEYVLNSQCFLRSGWNSLSKLSAGFGIKYGRFLLDYAYVSGSSDGWASHAVSLILEY
ncbi:MAG TPA: hypothetical protein VJC03_03610, partial [bacterium]|nr:hypothetical protein [bacterium]